MKKATALASNAGRIAWIPMTLVLLTAAPTAQAGLLHAAEEAAKVAHAAEEAAKLGEVQANGIKIESKVGGLEAKAASVEANAVKIEPGGEPGGGSGRGDDPPPWFYGLVFAGLGAWLFLKLRAWFASPQKAVK